MYYSSSGCHPLKIARSNYSLMTLEVFVIGLSLNHVGDGFKAAMGMVGEAGR